MTTYSSHHIKCVCLFGCRLPIYWTTRVLSLIVNLKYSCKSFAPENLQLFIMLTVGFWSLTSEWFGVWASDRQGQQDYHQIALCWQFIYLSNMLYPGQIHSSWLFTFSSHSFFRSSGQTWLLLGVFYRSSSNNVNWYASHQNTSSVFKKGWNQNIVTTYT